MNHRTAFILGLFIILAVATAANAQAPTYDCYVVGDYSHNVETSTQGLFFHNGELYESSGGYDKSYIARIDLDSGRILQKEAIPGKYFAEGMAPYGNAFLMLTWKSGTGFIYRLGTLEQIGTFAYRPKDANNEGWGLTFNGGRFIMSDGTARLYQHDTNNFTRLGSITVKDGNKPVTRLNELEFVNGYILANIWKSDKIAVIDASTARVEAWINLAPLRQRLFSGAGVANGIAYNHDTRELFVTGKNWDRLFAIEVDGFDLHQ